MPLSSEIFQNPCKSVHFDPASVLEARILIEAVGRSVKSDPVSAEVGLMRLRNLFEARPPVAGAARSDRGGLLLWQRKIVERYIAEHLAEPLRSCDLAKLIGLSSSYFARAFKMTYGEPPRGHIIRKRIEMAKEAMLKGQDSLSVIALECGFSDQAHFSRHFRRTVGETPAAWRRTRRGGVSLLLRAARGVSLLDQPQAMMRIA